ncbi:MAG: hypothetical protein QW625_03500, partial [Candidatus Nanoarchaeia archaeon]
PIVSAGIVLYPQNQAPTQASLTVSEATFLKPGEEQGFVALPFFINVTKPTDLDYRWSFEGQSVFKTDKSNQFSVKVAQGDLQESFSRELAVYVENPFNRIQSASGRIEIIVKK